MQELMDGMDVAESEYLNNGESLDEDDDSDLNSGTAKIYPLPCRNRLFDRDMPLHVILGSGTCTNVILWRNKETSTYIMAGATYVWILFKYMGYNLVTLLCHFLLVSATTLLLWSTLASFTDIDPPELPEVVLPEKLLVRIALSIRIICQRAYKTLLRIATGNNSIEFISMFPGPLELAIYYCLSLSNLFIFLSQFVCKENVFQVSGSLIAIALVGRWFSDETILYTLCMVLLTVPVIYEKNEDTIDSVAEELLMKLKKLSSKLKKNICQNVSVITSSKDERQP